MNTMLRSRGAAALMLLLLLLLSPYANGKVIDPQSPVHPVLDRIQRRLHRNGIDIVRDARQGVHPRERARVMDLEGFVSAADVRLHEPWLASFMKDFDEGRLGVLAAYKPTHGSADGVTSRAEFEKAWLETPFRRVFVSFTAKDHGYAMALKAALQADGYVVFTYLNEPDQPPSFSSAEVGHFFATAEHHLVIDTAEARRSPGGYWVTASGRRHGVECRGCRHPSHPREAAETEPGS